MTAAQRFTLVAGRWYAAEFIGDEFGEGVRSYSPIRVAGVRGLGSGQGEINVAFFHASYPVGVQQKSYRLKVIERQARFLLARSFGHDPTRLLLVYEATLDWLKQHFQLEAGDLGADIQAFMEQRCGSPLGEAACVTK